ncbi:hypothetical protein JQC91_07560 [Jannaschia sp. Os4]|uniref:hypothetical protein n=1 Tax=Jannaschia sp. Os4 TaxID=2807617 RepID=UPI00193AA4DC|nr:hypothetical protein [Jannaschia sp. Os4]MBM2576159.1 hypothetical protein [Jannaschia sp. Os4]
MRTLIYGYDPICGWCYGAAPAVRRVAAEMPVELAMAGLVVGARVGPAAAMEGNVRQASERLRAVTGRAPSEAFYAWMRAPGAVAASAPPAVAVDAVRRARPDAALAFAHAVTEAHYEQGMDPNDRDAYAALLAAHAPRIDLPDLHDPALAEAAFADGRALGVQAFPTFLVRRDDGSVAPVPTLYDGAALAAAARAA